MERRGIISYEHGRDVFEDKCDIGNEWSIFDYKLFHFG